MTILIAAIISFLITRWLSVPWRVGAFLLICLGMFLVEASIVLFYRHGDFEDFDSRSFVAGISGAFLGTMCTGVADWLSSVWTHDIRPLLVPTPRVRAIDEDAELAALLESGDTSPETLERMAKLMGQNDPNKDQF